jgi:hypothetical protein
MLVKAAARRFLLWSVRGHLSQPLFWFHAANDGGALSLLISPRKKRGWQPFPYARSMPVSPAALVSRHDLRAVVRPKWLQTNCGQ